MSQSLKTRSETGALTVDRDYKRLESLTAAKTLDDFDSGKIFTLNLAGGFAVTLPDPEDVTSGWNVRVIVGTAPTTAYTISSGSADIHVVGSSNEDAGGDAASTNGTAITTITFAANQAKAGDQLELVCDGSAYYCNYQVDEIAHLTLA